MLEFRIQKLAHNPERKQKGLREQDIHPQDGTFVPRVPGNISVKYLLLWSGGCAVKGGKGALRGKNGNFLDTTTCSGNSHPFHRAPCVLRDTLPRSGINSRALGLLWRPSILRAFSFWDMEEQISPLPFSGQTNGKAVWFVTRYRVSPPNVDDSTKATFREINSTMRNRSIACMCDRDCLSLFLSFSLYLTVIAVRLTDCRKSRL